MGLTSGTKLGPYEIQSPLGAGGMGEVYRARDTRLDRTVAIKILPAHLSSNPEAKQRFETQINCRKEANLLIGQRSRRRKQTKLPHHSNIVPIRKVLCDLAIDHPVHVDVLNLEAAIRRLHTHEHSASQRS